MSILPDLSQMWHYFPSNRWVEDFDKITHEYSGFFIPEKLPLCPHTDLIQICSRLCMLPDEKISLYYCGIWNKGRTCLYSSHQTRHTVCYCITVLSNLYIMLKNFDEFDKDITICDLRGKPSDNGYGEKRIPVTTIKSQDIYDIWKKIVVKEIEDLLNYCDIPVDTIDRQIIKKYAELYFHALSDSVLGSNNDEFNIFDKIAYAMAGYNISCPQAPKR